MVLIYEAPWKFNGSAFVELQLSKSFCSYLSLPCLPSPAVSILCPRKMARLFQRHDCCWASAQHIVPKGSTQQDMWWEGTQRVGMNSDHCSLISTEYVLRVFFSCILLFMLATPGSRVLDECNIACSLNYGAALMRGISQNVDKMNVVPHFLLLYELWEMQQFAWRV